MSPVPLKCVHDVPCIAFGTGTKWFYAKRDTTAELNRELVDTIKHALAAGLRHIDTAEMYTTEREVGVACAEFLAETPGLTRADLFVTHKVFHGIAADSAPNVIRASLQRTGLEYYDLYLLHAPFFDQLKWVGAPKTMAQVWRELEDAHHQGLVRRIGVSNFSISNLTELLKTCTIRPHLNQVEMHPCLQQRALVDFCRSHGIAIGAYGPLVPLHTVLSQTATRVDQGSHMTPEAEAALRLQHALEAPSARLGVTVADVLNAWVVQKGFVLVSTTSKVPRMHALMHIPDLTLTPHEMDEIDVAGAALTVRRYWPNAAFD